MFASAIETFDIHEILQVIMVWIHNDFMLSSFKQMMPLLQIVTYIHQIYSNELLKLKNIDYIYIYAFLCMGFIWDIIY
jgi:hypothetical protein